MIFSIQHASFPNTSYVMGTMHSRDKRAFTYFERACELMEHCKVYSPEMNTHEVDAVALQLAFLLPAGMELENSLGRKKFDKAVHMLLKAFGVPLEALSNMSPIFIQGAMMASCLGNDYAATLDQYLLDHALSKNMEIRGVESPEDQYQIARSLDPGVQIKQFATIIKRPDKFMHQAQRLADYYSQNQTNALYQLGKRGLGAFRKILLYERNYKMADTVYQYALENATFTGIGAAHLPGEKGILRLLKLKGCKIKQIV